MELGSKFMSAACLNSTVGDKYHTEITNLNVLATDTEDVYKEGSSCRFHVSKVC